MRFNPPPLTRLNAHLALAGLVLVDLGHVTGVERLPGEEEGQQLLHLHRLTEHGAVLLQQVPVRLLHPQHLQSQIDRQLQYSTPMFKSEQIQDYLPTVL